MSESSLYTKITQFIRRLSPFRDHANEQAGLVLIASLPCLILGLVSLRIAGASYYLISFFAIIFLLLIAYAAITGKNRANFQIQTLSNLVEAMIDGDYTLRGRQQSNPAFQELLNLINQLSDNLHTHKLKAEESQLLLDKIMQQMDALVFAVDGDGQLAMINEAARKSIGFDNDLSVGYSLQDIGMQQLINCEESTVVRLTQEKLSGEYFLFKDQFYNNNTKHHLYLLTKADKMLREKERESWQNLLRVLSHELNNSLTPIATFSNTMLRKINKEKQVTDLDKFRDGLAIINERAESLNEFVTSYSQLSHLPKANKQDYFWRDKLLQLTKLFGDCRFEHKLVHNDEFNYPILADSQQLEQVFINLFKNAREAMESVESMLLEPQKIETKELKRKATETKLVEIGIEHDDNNLVIIIKDNGCGIANPKNLFVPFYTTKKSGSGIGLTLCQQIINNHNGTMFLTNRENTRGAKVTLTLPRVR